MNDFVLRGFCKKCDDELTFELEFYGKKGVPEEHRGTIDSMHLCEPVFFLSAKQIEIILESKDYEEYFERKFSLRNPLPVGKMFRNLIEDEPFLVAKILKEAGNSSQD